MEELRPRLRDAVSSGWAGRVWRSAAIALSLAILPAGVQAAGSIQWTAPDAGGTYAVGDTVNPFGTASGFGVGGVGLDIALVLDASTSMLSGAGPWDNRKPRWQWQADAALALVQSLPATNTSVAVVSFGTVAGTTVRLPLTPTTSLTDIEAAITGVAINQGSTAIGTGIVQASSEIAANGTDSRASHLVVLSDGAWNTGINPLVAAADASAAGIQVHSVALPGSIVTTMSQIADNGGGTFVNATDPNDLVNIASIFSGQGGSFVGVEQVDLTLPDGTVLANVALDAFGNFSVPAGWSIQEGENTFIASSIFADGSTATASLTLFGTVDAPIPLPAAGWMLLAGLAAMGMLRRARGRV